MPCGKDTGISLFSWNWASMFDGLFCRHPFLLPCVWGAFLHLLVLPCCFALPETGGRKNGYLPGPKMDEVTAPKSKPKSADASVLPTIAGASYSEESSMACSDGSRTAGTVNGDTEVVE